MRNEIILECRNIFFRHFEPILSHFFENIDDQLFALSEKAESSTLQALYFDAMRYVRIERDEVKKKYLSRVKSQYDTFWQNSDSIDTRSDQKQEDQNNLELVKMEVLEEVLAVSTMVEKNNNLYYRDLYDLNIRFGVLAGEIKIENDSNPLAPAQLCSFFETVLIPLTLDLRVKLVIYKLFDTLVISRLGTVYNELNATLISRGIQPTISRKASRTAMPEAMANNAKREPIHPSSVNSEHDTFEQTTDPTSLKAFQTMQMLMGNWRSQLGIPSLATRGAAGFTSGPAYQTNEVLHALSGLQQSAPAYSHYTDSADENIKAIVAGELQRLSPNKNMRSLPQMEEDIIDIVAMIFDFIFEDTNLPDAIKALIGRLQIPIVKLAILEKSFLTKKSHPARRLLNDLGKASVGLDSDACGNSPIFLEIQRIVNRILSEFDKDVGIFETVLDEFLSFVKKEEKRTQKIEERTQKATESEEQLQLAKQASTLEIAHRLQDKAVPLVIRNILEDAWKNVLMLSYLRRDKEVDGWEKALFVVDQVLWITAPTADLAEKNRKLKALPGLIKNIRKGLETVSYDPHKMTHIFKELEACNTGGVKAVAPKIRKNGPKLDDNVSDVDTSKGSVVDPVSQENNREVKDPHLEAQIDLVAGNLPDVDGDQAVGSYQKLGDGIPKPKNRISSDSVSPLTNVWMPTHRKEEVHDENIDKAIALEVGQWLEILGENNEKNRVKLSWKSRATSTYVFVNQKGIKVMEKPLQEFAAELRKGKIRIIENADSPLMDRALSSLMETLQDPKSKHAHG